MYGKKKVKILQVMLKYLKIEEFWYMYKRSNWILEKSLPVHYCSLTAMA